MEMTGIPRTVEKVQVHQYVSTRSMSAANSRRSNNNEEDISCTTHSPECLDHMPLHDVYDYFKALNRQFFQGKLNDVGLLINSHMTRSIGNCSFRRSNKNCVIRLSQFFLKKECKKVVLETLLHEMIHAYLFITNNDDTEDDGHGPNFKKHMKRINKMTGLNITIYYEYDIGQVNKKEYWVCDVCQKKRSSADGPPGPRKSWWAEHSRNCGGTYRRVTELRQDRGKGARSSNSVVRKSL